MLGFLADFQTLLGIKIDWGAIGSFGALVLAIRLALRQNSDVRRREAAVVHGVVATASPLLQALRRFESAWTQHRSFLEQHPEAKSWDEEADRDFTAFCERRGKLGAEYRELSSERRLADTRVAVQAERVFKRLQKIEPLGLPSVPVIEAVHELELAVEHCLTTSELLRVGVLREQLPVMEAQVSRLEREADELSYGKANRVGPAESRVGRAELGRPALAAINPVIYVIDLLGLKRRHGETKKGV